MLYQMTYYSRCTFPVEEGTARAELEAILSKARANNGRDALTGFLTFDPPWFVQVLEGPRDYVLAAFTRIKKDGRHRDLVEISGRDIRNRSFPTWSMNAAMRGPETDAIYLRHGLSAGMVPSHLQAAQLLMLAMDLQNHEEVAHAQVRFAG